MQSRGVAVMNYFYRLLTSAFILTVINACGGPYAEVCDEYDTAMAELDSTREKLNIAAEKINHLRDSYSAQVGFPERGKNPLSFELEIATAEYESLEEKLEVVQVLASEVTDSYNAALTADKKPACVKRHAEATCESSKTAKAQYKTALKARPVEILRPARNEYETLKSQAEAAQAELEVKLEDDYNAAIRDLAGFTKTEYDEARAQYDTATAELEVAKTKLDTIVKAKESDVDKAEAKVSTAKDEYEAAKAESDKEASDVRARINAIHQAVQSKYKAALQGLEARFKAKEIAARAKYDAASLKEERMKEVHGTSSPQRKNAYREKKYFEGEWQSAKDAYDAANRAASENDPKILVDWDVKYEADMVAANAELDTANQINSENTDTNLSAIKAKLAETEAELREVKSRISKDIRVVEDEVAEALTKVRNAKDKVRKLENDIRQTVVTDNALMVQNVELLSSELRKAKGNYDSLRNNPRSAVIAYREAYYAARDLAKEFAVTHEYADHMSMPCW